MKKLVIVLAVIGALALVGCEPPDPPVTKYTVTYNVNLGTGTVPAAAEYVEAATVTVAAGTGLSKTGLRFGGWNTMEDGSGTTHLAGSTFAIGAADLTLYAKWEDPIVGTWSSDYDLQGMYINVTDVTTITATTFSTTRTLRWTSNAVSNLTTVLQYPPFNADAGTAALLVSSAAIANDTVVQGAQLDAIYHTTYKNLFGFTGVSGSCSQVVVSGTYTRELGSALFALTDNTKNNTPAITAAAATFVSGEAIGSPAINPYTGYFTRSVTQSTLGDTAGSPAAPVSATNPKPQNWMTHFTDDMNTLTLWDGGTVMPVTRL